MEQVGRRIDESAHLLKEKVEGVTNTAARVGQALIEAAEDTKERVRDAYRAEPGSNRLIRWVERLNETQQLMIGVGIVLIFGGIGLALVKLAE